jgi:hypothetical protein
MAPIVWRVRAPRGGGPRLMLRCDIPNPFRVRLLGWGRSPRPSHLRRVQATTLALSRRVTILFSQSRPPALHEIPGLGVAAGEAVVNSELKPPKRDRGAVVSQGESTWTCMPEGSSPRTATWRAPWPLCHIDFDGVVCYDRCSGIAAHGGRCEPQPTTGCDAGGPMAIASAAPHRSDGGLMLGHPGCGKQAVQPATTVCVGCRLVHDPRDGVGEPGSKDEMGWENRTRCSGRMDWPSTSRDSALCGSDW